MYECFHCGETVSVSQLQTYMSCKKKWQYNYVYNIKPRVERTYLTIGKLCHKGMQVAMQKIWENEQWESAMNYGVSAIQNEWALYVDDTPLLDEELSEFEQMLSDACSVFTQAFEEFEPWKYEVVLINKPEGSTIPALELHFVVPCNDAQQLQGFIDAILKDKETGSIWCTDYKFRKSLSPDEDEAFNIQNAVYSYACNNMGINITGTMTWQHLNTPASDPKINKDGTISTAKIKTTWSHYAKFCEEHGQDPQDYYNDMQTKLDGIEWYRATYEYRNKETIENIWNCCVIPVANEVKNAKHNNNYRSMYPWNCKMCQYQSLCQSELRGYDVESIMKREYTIRDR